MSSAAAGGPWTPLAALLEESGISSETVPLRLAAEFLEAGGVGVHRDREGEPPCIRQAELEEVRAQLQQLQQTYTLEEILGFYPGLTRVKLEEILAFNGVSPRYESTRRSSVIDLAQFVRVRTALDGLAPDTGDHLGDEGSGSTSEPPADPPVRSVSSSRRRRVFADLASKARRLCSPPMFALVWAPILGFACVIGLLMVLIKACNSARSPAVDPPAEVERGPEPPPTSNEALVLATRTNERVALLEISLQVANDRVAELQRQLEAEVTLRLQLESQFAAAKSAAEKANEEFVAKLKELQRQVEIDNDTDLQEVRMLLEQIRELQLQVRLLKEQPKPAAQADSGSAASSVLTDNSQLGVGPNGWTPVETEILRRFMTHHRTQQWYERLGLSETAQRSEIMARLEQEAWSKISEKPFPTLQELAKVFP